MYVFALWRLSLKLEEKDMIIMREREKLRIWEKKLERKRRRKEERLRSLEVSTDDSKESDTVKGNNDNDGSPGKGVKQRAEMLESISPVSFERGLS